MLERKQVAANATNNSTHLICTDVILNEHNVRENEIMNVNAEHPGEHPRKMNVLKIDV